MTTEDRTPPTPPTASVEGNWKERLPEVTVLFGDARDVLPLIPGGVVDCVLTDPPFGKDYQSNRVAKYKQKPKIEGDASKFEVDMLLDDTINHVYRVMRDKSFCYLFAQRVEEIEFQMLCLDCDPSLEYSGKLYWHMGRSSGDNTGGSFTNCMLEIAVLKKGKAKLSGHPENFIKAGRPYGQIYPTEKPITGLETIIEYSTKRGDVVLDFCAGSGTTGIAAALNGRKAILIDKNPQAIEIMKRRVTQHGFSLATELPVEGMRAEG